MGFFVIICPRGINHHCAPLAAQIEAWSALPLRMRGRGAAPLHNYVCYLRGVDPVCHPCPRGSELSRNRSGGTSAASDHPPHTCTTSSLLNGFFGQLPAGAPIDMPFYHCFNVSVFLTSFKINTFMVSHYCGPSISFHVTC